MKSMGIREVWNDNLLEELDGMMDVVDRYPFISVDTEFPGVVIRPIGSFTADAPLLYRYQIVRSNVDLLQLIQVAFSFADEHNNKPEPIHTWQFNLKFDINSDMFSQDSIEILMAAGIDFSELARRGIESQLFAEHIMVSGLVLNPDVSWIGFHSGFDFAYLLRMLSALPLPKTHTAFLDLVQIYFPNIYDLKYLMRSCEALRGGLSQLANGLNVSRIGPEHQSGSDALLTADSFFAMRSKYFGDNINAEKFKDLIFGLS
uniref:poly(A)-specific ribonuclease n=1 Tax=Spongospora subterranea TaxID=70186 RepID=A0A0H5R9P7_9EUKA|eukprot:CRZ10407.1 hypothetical protein [Spongospora subterranea]